MRTITVKGVGNVQTRPDYTVITFQLEAQLPDYEETMALASRQIEEINRSLAAVGFSKVDLKTTNFNIRTEYRSEKDRNGNYRRIFDGYVCHHDMKLCFDFDNSLLGRTLSALASTSVNPELSVRFTVKDPNAINEALLRDAAVNAKGKAEILCSASGVRLGQLMSVDYNWGELDIYSHTNYEVADGCAPTMALCETSFSADFEPDDIKVSDSVTFVWEIN